MLMSEPFSGEYKCVKSLRELASKMITLKYSVVYKDFFKLVIYLLTLPVTSATCERTVGKVDLIKSAVSACMLSDRLEDLVIISSEKSVVDSLDLSSVVNRFAMIEMVYRCENMLIVLCCPTAVQNSFDYCPGRCMLKYCIDLY